MTHPGQAASERLMKDMITSYVIANPATSVAELRKVWGSDFDDVMKYGDHKDGIAAVSDEDVVLGFTPDQIELVLAHEAGQNDGEEWLAVLQLNDGRFVTITAGCDYTGWDCQAGGRHRVARSLPDILAFGLTDEERTRLKVVL